MFNGFSLSQAYQGIVNNKPNRERLETALSNLDLDQEGRSERKIKEPKSFGANRVANLACLRPIEEFSETPSEAEGKDYVCDSSDIPTRQMSVPSIIAAGGAVAPANTPEKTTSTLSKNTDFPKILRTCLL